MSVVGRMVGSFELQEAIGSGGMALVFRAIDTRNNTQVALKLLRQEHQADQVKVERFLREARGDLSHEHIVPIYEMGTSGNYHYIAMKYVSGGSLDDWLAQTQGALPEETVCDLLAQIATALDFAHNHGVVHRDLKPSNVMLSPDKKRAYLADFGIAQVTGQETITEFGSLVGTPEFMSPEQIQGGRVDGRSDIYSLGVTLYLALTGHLPFTGDAASTLFHQVNSDPEPITKVRPELDPRLNRIISRAMAKKPAKRYQQARELAGDLRQVVLTDPPKKLAYWLIGVVLLVIIGAAALSWPNMEEVRTSMEATAEGNSAAVIPDEATATPAVTEEAVEVATLAVAVLTNTPTPTSVATETPPPTATPSPTAMTTTTAVSSPSPTPTETPEEVFISLIGPAHRTTVRANTSNQRFAWFYPVRLGANDYFEVRFFRNNQRFDGGTFGADSNQEIMINLAQFDAIGRGEYQWEIALLRRTSGQPILLQRSFRRTIFWEG